MNDVTATTGDGDDTTDEGINGYIVEIRHAKRGAIIAEFKAAVMVAFGLAITRLEQLKSEWPDR